MKPTALVTEKTRLRKSESGRIGSAARALDDEERDRQRRRRATIRATICGEPQA